VEASGADAIGALTGRDSDAAWRSLGRNDPFFGVLSDERYHKSRLTDEARDEFFETGVRHVDADTNEDRKLTSGFLAG